jgi:homoserine kinase type II
MAEKLDLEFDVLDHLEERGFPYEVPVPLENEYGNRLSRIDGEYVIVAPFIEGTTPTELDRAKRAEMGRGLGRYHRAVEDYPADFYYDDRVFSWLRDRLDDFHERETAATRLEMIEFFLDSLDELADRGFEGRMDALRPDALPAHADFQTDNLLFDGDDLVGVVDFDNIRPQPAVVDLAWTVSLTCYSDADAFEPDSMAAVLDGYTSVRSLPERERRLLLPVVVLHHGVRFALGYPEALSGGKRDELRQRVDRASSVRAHL